MKPVLHQIIPVVTFIVLLTAASVILLHMSSKQVNDKEPTRHVVPGTPLLTVDDAKKVACLPRSTTFTPRTCAKQADCGPCTEATSCVATEGTLEIPVPPQGDCGHGHRGEDGACVCDGEWDGDECATDVCYSGDTCGTAHVKLDPGQYCLPDYMNKCNPYTSDTLLSTGPHGTSWSCKCKSTMAGVFVQGVEGGSCDVQVACGRSPVSAQVNVGTLRAPRFQTRTVQPNRIVSYEDRERGSVPCAYKTTTNAQGDVVPHPQADPTCIPRIHSNKCTITDGHGHRQVIRGSGAPGDPEIKRTSPHFNVPVPPGLNRCPDGWDGHGTDARPCTKQGEDSFTLFTEEGGWKGPDATSMQTLKSWWGGRGRWTGVNYLAMTDVNCFEHIFGETSESLCVSADCDAAYGTRKRDWDGDVDGPLTDRDGRPQWETEGDYGGQCECAPGETSDGWRCVNSNCANASHPDAYEDGDTCVCPPQRETLPFATSIPYKHPNAAATCVDDPCNPSGVAVNAAQTTCTDESDCTGVCVQKQCYIPTGLSCDSDANCSNMTGGMSQNVAKCVDNACVILDMQRAQMGSTCSDDANCSLGACTGDEGAKTCTGGCACSSGFKQVSDGGVSPLGATCVDDCVGKCKNGGMCVPLPNGSTECRCTAFYGGEHCETAVCASDYEYCDAQTPCCNQCLCNSQSSSCCNRFPDLKAPDQNSVLACVNNTCQPNKLSDADYASLQCFDGQGQCKPASHYTPEPLVCSGWGAMDADGRCRCHASRVGDACQDKTCSDEHQQCTFDADCCNNCECEAGDADCCPPTFDASKRNMSCTGGFCKANVTPKTSTCKDADGLVCREWCHQANVPWILYVDPAKKIAGTVSTEKAELVGLNRMVVIPGFEDVTRGETSDGFLWLQWVHSNPSQYGVVRFTQGANGAVTVSLRLSMHAGVYQNTVFADEIEGNDVTDIFANTHVCIADGRTIQSRGTSSYLLRYSHVDQGVDPCLWGMYDNCKCSNPFANTNVKWGVLDAYGNKIWLYQHPGKSKYYDAKITFIGGRRVYHASSDTYVLVSNFEDAHRNINIEVEVDDPTRMLNPRKQMTIRLRLVMGRASGKRTITAERTVSYTNGCGLINAMKATSNGSGLAVNERYCDSRRGPGNECNGGGVLYLKWFD